MKPLHYAYVGAGALAILLTVGIMLGRATKYCEVCQVKTIDVSAPVWKLAAAAWRSAFEKGVAEREVLKAAIAERDSMLAIPVKTKVDETIRVIDGWADDSLAKRGLAAPRQVR